MKKVSIVVVFLCIFASAKSQDTAKINLYAGLVGTGFVSVDTGDIAKWANFRVAVRMKETITKSVSFDGWLGYDPGYDVIFFRASLKKTWKNGGISFGYQPTPVSEICPYPLSVDGQFLFTAEGMPPGGTLGTSLWYKSLKAGFYVRKGKPEYQLTYTGKVFSTGFWTSSDEFGGITAKLDLPLLYAMATVTGDDRQGLALAIQPIKKIPYKIVCDFAIRDGKISNNLVGIQHPFKTKKFSDARFGIAYDFQNRSAGAFFLVGINHKE